MQMQAYIEQSGLVLDVARLPEYIGDYVREMADGLAGRGGSLKMIPTYLSPGIVAAAGEKVISVDMGGTNLRVALVDFGGAGRPEIVYRENYGMPGTMGRITIDAFFAQIAELLEPVAKQSDRIGICFSFPCEIMPNLDGRIIGFNKEVDVAGAEGQMIADGLRRAMAARGLPGGHRVVVTNDTTATLLGGRAVYRQAANSGFVGMILGTGTNCCYAERNVNITKAPALAAAAGETYINMESGGYAKVPRTRVDVAFDATTAAPNTQLFEKLVSGAYQGGLLLAYVRDAAAAGCFSGAVCERLKAMDRLESKHIDIFLEDPEGDNPLAALTAGYGEAREGLRLLIDAFFARAAYLVVTSLCGIATKMGAGGDAASPLYIAAEGSTFYKSALLHGKILGLTEGAVRECLGLHCVFVHADDATLTGTAYAAV